MRRLTDECLRKPLCQLSYVCNVLSHPPFSEKHAEEKKIRLTVSSELTPGRDDRSSFVSLSPCLLFFFKETKRKNQSVVIT